MRMISQVVEYDSVWMHCCARIRADNPLLVDSCFPVYAGIELLAQACGLLFGARRQEADCTPVPGAIVQIKSFQLEGASIPVGTTLQVHGHFEGGSQQAALFSGEVQLDGTRILSGSLMLALLDGGGI